MDGFEPLAQNNDHLMTLKIKNHAAMVALVQGTATAADVSTLIAMYNVSEALHKMGVGAEFSSFVTDGRAALTDIVHRSHKIGKYTPTGSEIQTLNKLMELHDAQLDVITVKDMDAAIKMAQKEINSGKATNLRKPNASSSNVPSL